MLELRLTRPQHARVPLVDEHRTRGTRLGPSGLKVKHSQSHRSKVNGLICLVRPRGGR